MISELVQYMEKMNTADHLDNNINLSDQGSKYHRFLRKPNLVGFGVLLRVLGLYWGFFGRELLDVVR